MKHLILALIALAATSATAAQNSRCAVAVQSISSPIAQGLIEHGFTPYEVRCPNPGNYVNLNGNFSCVSSGYIAYTYVTDYGIGEFNNPDPTGITQFFITGYNTQIYNNGHASAQAVLGFRKNGHTFAVASKKGRGRDTDRAELSAAQAIPNCSSFR